MSGWRPPIVTTGGIMNLCGRCLQTYPAAADHRCDPDRYEEGRAAGIAEGRMEWQPIESAPKDGTPVLAVRNDEIIIAYWHRDQYAMKPRPYWHGTDKYYRGATFCRQNPIAHWMPLPAPPKP